MPAQNRTPKDAPDPRPVHERIATDLRREILSGDLAVGSPLPSNKQLVARFGASGASVQKALDLLKEESLVAGRAGASVTVLPGRRQTMTPAAYSKPAEDGESYRWITEAEQRGQTPKIQILEVGEVRPPADVAAVLELGDEGKAILRKQLLSLGGEPCELVHSYYPTEIADGTAIAGRAKIKGGTPTLLAEMGYPPLRTVDKVTAEEATTEEYEALQLPRQISVLRTFRVVLSHDDRPIEVTTMAKAGHLYALQYEF